MGIDDELSAEGRSGEQPDPGLNGEHNFYIEWRTSDRDASTIDPEARLVRKRKRKRKRKGKRKDKGKDKDKEAKLCFMSHLLMENRHGLLLEGG